MNKLVIPASLGHPDGVSGAEGQGQSTDPEALFPVVPPPQSVVGPAPAEQSPQELFPVLPPAGVATEVINDSSAPPVHPGFVTQGLDSADLLTFDDPRVLCKGCRHGHIMSSAFAQNRRADGSVFRRYAGFCTVFKAEPLPLEDFRPDECTNFEPRVKGASDGVE